MREREPVDRAELVERCDRAEAESARMALAIAQVMYSHRSCICRHTKRILTDAVPADMPKFAFRVPLDTEVTE